MTRRPKLAGVWMWVWLHFAAFACGSKSEANVHLMNDSTLSLKEEQEEDSWTLAERLAMEPIPPDKIATLMHTYEGAGPDMKVLIRTAVEMEQTEPILRCAACEAALGEVQMMLMAHMKTSATQDPRSPHWTTYWFEMIVEDKMATVTNFFTTQLCTERMRFYGLHKVTQTYVPARMGVHSIQGLDTSPEVSEFLTNQCKYLEYAYKPRISQKLGNDTFRINRQIVSKGGALKEQLPVLWHSARKEICDTVTRSKGACLEQEHPFSGGSKYPRESPM